MNTISPLSLPFELAIQPSQFIEQIQTSVEHELRSGILVTGTKPLGVALAGAKFIMEDSDNHLHPLATVWDLNLSAPEA